MRNTFKVLFYIKKNAPLRNGNTPIMGRITINGQRTQLSTQLSVNPNLWDVSMGRAAGRSAVASHVNEQLSQIRFHIERCYNTLFYEHALVTPKMVKEMYFGNDQRNETLLAFFRHHNEEFSRMVGISRSAFYKYRDAIAPFQNLMAGRIITFQIMLKDKAGILSEILTIFANCGANILTINQSIPTGGRAMVTISAETSNLNCNIEALTQQIAERTGVVKADCVAG